MEKKECQFKGLFEASLNLYLVTPTKNVTSHSSGMEARNFKSSARPDLFSNIVKSGSSAAIGPSLVRTSGIFLFFLSLSLSVNLSK